MPFLRSAALAAIALLAAVAAGSPAVAQTPPPPADEAADKAADIDPAKMVVAKVGDAEVTLADLIAMREELPAQYRQMPLQMIYPALLERAMKKRSPEYESYIQRTSAFFPRRPILNPSTDRSSMS